MDDESYGLQAADGGDGDGALLDYGAAGGDGSGGGQDDGADGDGAEDVGDDAGILGQDDAGDGSDTGGAQDDTGYGASALSLVATDAGYNDYEPSPYQIRDPKNPAEILGYAAMDTIGAAGDGVLSLMAHGVGGVAGLLGNEQDAANWHDVGAKELENARAAARNAMRDVGVMVGDREARPYPDGHDQCPAPHES